MLSGSKQTLVITGFYCANTGTEALDWDRHDGGSDHLENASQVAIRDSLQKRDCVYSWTLTLPLATPIPDFPTLPSNRGMHHVELSVPVFFNPRFSLLEEHLFPRLHDLKSARRLGWCSCRDTSQSYDWKRANWSLVFTASFLTMNATSYWCFFYSPKKTDLVLHRLTSLLNLPNLMVPLMSQQ